MNFTNLSLAQLRAATKAQIVTAIDTWLANNPKRRIIEVLLDIADGGEVPDDRAFTYHSNGLWETCLDVVRDALGSVRRSVGVRRTFTPDTSVDTIVRVDYDAAGIAQRRTTITYFHDGRQPTVTVEV